MRLLILGAVLFPLVTFAHGSPIETLENILVYPVEPPMSRRSFAGGNSMIITNNQDDNKISPWCSVAILCQRKMNPVCGYDDNFGYGKFDDVCHMLQVNCYWKYNFALVPSCKPVLEGNPNLGLNTKLT